MKQLIWGLGVAAIMAGPAFAQTATKTSTTKAAMTDDKLDHRIEARIAASAALQDDHCTVDVKDHVATLSGSVDSNADKMRAASLAKIPGVTKVDNNITVEAKEHQTVKGTAGTAVDKTKDAAETVGHKT